MNITRSFSNAALLLLVLLPVACVSSGGSTEVGPGPGFSGMAQMCPASYVVVHDVKAHKKGSRFGLLSVRLGRDVHYQPLAVADWVSPDGRASDLESICAVPGRPGEFLAAESGSWEGRKGRLFHIQVAGLDARILSVHELPLLKDNGPTVKGDNFEGLACLRLPGPADRLLVVLGERGGTPAYPKGVLRWGTLDLEKREVSWNGVTGVPVPGAPGNWVVPGKKRDISALHLDPGMGLWAVATEDESDDGPFRSVIYRVATLRPNAADPIEIVANPKTSWIVEGLKVEAIAGPSATTPRSPLSYASEDEHFGGIWRPLYREATGE